ncbi:DUF883 C-terminal domain-containing protein [Marinospirillum sp.]|uniref:DUF883 family protein n=1 Tax=Marinospirillum sp. TaxID=2183934 RepID=UPI0028705461|nr:DUF883 C-terminal domain-containing protein [Marinospirillum sp.]MDR9468450.1 DUF883 C-terminal domain-containing protein [Marinospirillum sp.]
MVKTSEHETIDKVAGKVHEAVDRAANSAGKAEEYAREHGADGRKKVDEVFGGVNHYVRDNPLMSIGIAFAVGALFSSLKNRR